MKTSLQKKYKLSKSTYDIAEVCYIFANKMTANSIIPKDYGTGEMYTSVEAHIVTAVYQYPGITAKEIATGTGRTQSAVSQVVKKLMAKGLVRTEKHPEDGRKTCLFVTEKGEELAIVHKKYDEAAMKFAIDSIADKLGTEAMENFIEILYLMTLNEYW